MKMPEHILSSNMTVTFACRSADPALFLQRTMGGVCHPEVIDFLTQRCCTPPGDTPTSPSPCCLIQSSEGGGMKEQPGRPDQSSKQ